MGRPLILETTVRTPQDRRTRTLKPRLRAPHVPPEGRGAAAGPTSAAKTAFGKSVKRAAPLGGDGEELGGVSVRRSAALAHSRTKLYHAYRAVHDLRRHLPSQTLSVLIVVE